ncbi:MAG: nucleotidyltransferase family protein [Pyrinomonadaceae bacterium]|nr:nucleotidyltransferase family protein [Pyrinomonadaceae bacterium]
MIVDLAMLALPEISDQVTSRPEHELVVCCSRTQVSEQKAARIKALLEKEIDWEYLYCFARRHSVLSLLYLQLSTIAPFSVPPEELSRLKDYYQKNAGRNLYLTNELVRILKDFALAGIEAIPYKGPALAVSAYGNLELRRFVDLDIMVRKADVSQAKELLIAQGYCCGTAWTSTQQSLLLRSQHNLTLSREQGRMIVELHWEVAPELFATSFQAERLWDRLEPISLNNLTVRSLSPEDLFLSLCVHGSKHLWTRLAWICDVAEILRTQRDLDWTALCTQARLTGTARMMFLGLYLANCLFDAPLPVELKKRVLSDETIAALAQEVAVALFSGTEPALPTLRQSFGFNIRLRQTWRLRARYCRFLFKPTDGDLGAVKLPASLTFAYYIMRPLRLLRAERERRLTSG